MHDGGQRDPFEQLERCHRRMEEELASLQQASDAIARGVAFFARTGARHTADEEQSLFPRLEGRPELAGVLGALTAEHREHDRVYAGLEALVAGAGGPSLVSLVDELARVYREHIEREEKELLPAARELLGETERAAMAE